jgi:hypothetical protein
MRGADSSHRARSRKADRGHPGRGGLCQLRLGGAGSLQSVDRHRLRTLHPLGAGNDPIRAERLPRRVHGRILRGPGFAIRSEEAHRGAETMTQFGIYKFSSDVEPVVIVPLSRWRRRRIAFAVGGMLLGATTFILGFGVGVWGLSKPTPSSVRCRVVYEQPTFRYAESKLECVRACAARIRSTKTGEQQ